MYLRYMRRRQWHPTPVLLPGKSHGQRSLVGCSPWDHKDSDMTSLSLFTFMYWRRKWQPTPVFLPGEFMGLHRVGHDCSDLAAAAAAAYPPNSHTHTPVSLNIPGRYLFSFPKCCLLSYPQGIFLPITFLLSTTNWHLPLALAIYLYKE